MICTAMRIRLTAFLVLLALPCAIMAQETHPEHPPETPAPARGSGCIDVKGANELLRTLGANWGYGYDSLLKDLGRWGQNRNVTIDSIGASVQGRGIWELTITSAAPSAVPRRRIYIHARTHPGEIQSFRVTDEIINYLLSDEEYPKMLLERTIFHIVPMYNPDGVELERPRENANNIDLERGWDKTPMEPEVAALKARFTELMGSVIPIDIALNMHSALACRRYFVYHDETGTSTEFGDMQRQFITGVRSYFMEGMEPWNYLVSWKNETPTHFPESWYWLNYGSNVLALTYEDMNCSAAGLYDSTARAIVQGIGNYLELTAPSGILTESGESGFALEPNIPNPFSGSTQIRFRLPSSMDVTIEVYSLDGRRVATVADGRYESGAYSMSWNADTLPAGVYICRIRAGEHVATQRMVVR